MPLLFAGLFYCAVSAQGEESDKTAWSGSLRAAYDYRELGAYEDHDAYGFWSLRGRGLAGERAEVYASGRLHSDLDGTGGSSFDPFSSLDQSSRDDVRLFQLYVDLHSRDKEVRLRSGRQYVDVADYLQMDGLQLMLYEDGIFGGRVFMGMPAGDYTSIDDDFRGFFGGVSLVGRPFKGNRSRATYARYEDESESGADDHAFVDLYQQVMDELSIRSYLSIMNGDVRMGGADLYYVSLEEKVFDAAFGVRRWGDYTIETRAYSPLIQVLGDNEPYTTAYGRLTTQLMPMIYLSPGAMIRRPDDSNAGNLDFDRYDINLIFEPFDALSVSAAFEHWDVEGDERFQGVSGDIRYRHRKLWELSVGAAYADYTYLRLPDLSLVAVTGDTRVTEDGTRIETSPYVYTYYLRGRWKLSEKTALRISGEVEDESDADDLAYRIRTSFEVRL